VSLTRESTRTTRKICHVLPKALGGKLQAFARRQIREMSGTAALDPVAMIVRATARSMPLNATPEAIRRAAPAWYVIAL